MQDQIIASHTCFGRHVDVNMKSHSQTLNVFFLPEKDYKHTRDTIYTHFKAYLTISMVWKTLFLLFF